MFGVQRLFIGLTTGTHARWTMLASQSGPQCRCSTPRRSCSVAALAEDLGSRTRPGIGLVVDVVVDVALVKSCRPWLSNSRPSVPQLSSVAQD